MRYVAVVLYALVAPVFLSACDSDSGGPTGGPTGPTPTTTQRDGQVVFWTDATTGWSRIDITLDGRSIGSLTSYLDSSPFGCSTSDEASVVATLSRGTYSYRAEDVGGEVSWSGDNVTIDSGGCLKYQLWCGDDRRCGP